MLLLGWTVTLAILDKGILFSGTLGWYCLPIAFSSHKVTTL